MSLGMNFKKVARLSKKLLVWFQLKIYIKSLIKEHAHYHIEYISKFQIELSLSRVLGDFLNYIAESYIQIYYF